MIKISIIVPVYNKEKELRKCLDSLVMQTLHDIEIIVIDDFSNDNSRLIIDEYAKKYPKMITKSFNEKNMGIGFTRNKGISLANGQYLGFVDADDYVDIKMYDDYYNFAIDNGLDLVTGYYMKFGDDSGIFKNKYFNICSLKNNPSVLLDIDYGPCNKIFKKNIVIRNNIRFEENLKYEDMPFVFKFLKHADLIGHIGKSYYHYYIHSNSETTIVDRRVFDMFKIMDMFNEYYVNFEDKEVILALNILQITRYMLQQKYQENSKYRKEFIEKGYNYLDAIDVNWRKNRYYCSNSFFKRMIINSKLLLSLYCTIMKNK